MPGVPAVAELTGMGNYRFTNWMGLFAPAKTPPPVVERIGSEVARMMQDPATRKLMQDNGVEPHGLRGVEFGSFLAAERQRYKKVAMERGIHFEE